MELQTNIRVCIQQPSVATYRTKFYEELNERCDVILLYGRTGLKSKLPKGVRSKFVKQYIVSLFKVRIVWHQAQLNAVSSNYDVAILSWDIQYLSLWLSLLKNIFVKR